MAIWAEVDISPSLYFFSTSSASRILSKNTPKAHTPKKKKKKYFIKRKHTIEGSLKVMNIQYNKK